MVAWSLRLVFASKRMSQWFVFHEHIALLIIKHWRRYLEKEGIIRVFRKNSISPVFGSMMDYEQVKTITKRMIINNIARIRLNEIRTFWTTACKAKWMMQHRTRKMPGGYIDRTLCQLKMCVINTHRGFQICKLRSICAVLENSHGLDYLGKIHYVQIMGKKLLLYWEKKGSCGI